MILMGRVKELIPEYIFDSGYDLDKYAFRCQLDELIGNGLFEDKLPLREFLEDVMPHYGRHFIFITDDDGTVYNIPYTREECINALCCLSQYEFTLFWHPSSFSSYDWVDENDVRSASCLYVDIDDIGMYADLTDKETAVNFLKETYGLTDEYLPKFLSLSGRGIHLVYPIEEMFFWDTTKVVKKKYKKGEPKEKQPCPYRSKCSNSEICTNCDVCVNREIYKRYNASLIARFDADFTGNNLNHMYRCPTSYNLKERPIQGKLFKLNDSDDRDIHRLDWALKTEEEIIENRRSYYARRSEKSKATKERNLKRKQEFLEALNDLSLEEFLKKDDISPENRAFAQQLLDKLNKPKKKKKSKSGSDHIIKEDDIDDLFENTTLPYKHLKYYDNYKPENRRANLLLDLNNFFIRHRGMLVSRNLFFFIIATYLKQLNQPSYYAVKYCRKYCDQSFYKEMKKTVLATYNSEAIYHFTYEYIALALGFSEEDIQLSYCNFSKERKKEAKRKNKRIQYEKTLAKQNKPTFKEKREAQLDYLRENPEMDEEAAKFILGIGRTTYYNLKKELKNAENL